MNNIKYGPYRLFVKRLIDIVCSLLTIVLLSWLYVIIAIMVKVKLGSPVIFKQERPGKIDPKTGKETIFCLYKFRTMNDEKDANGELLPDEDRLTPFGLWLRKSSIDEIPEAFNILKGDRGIIGTTKKTIEYSKVVTA